MVVMKVKMLMVFDSGVIIIVVVVIVVVMMMVMVLRWGRWC